MFCTKCGNNLPEGTKFCSKCGTPVAGPAPQPVAPEQPAAPVAPEPPAAPVAPEPPMAPEPPAAPVAPEAPIAPEPPAAPVAPEPPAAPAPQQAPPQAQQYQTYTQPGTPPPAPGQQYQAYTQPGAPMSPQQAPKKKSKKPLIITLAIIALVIILALVAIFVWPFGNLGGSGSTDVEENPLGAAYSGIVNMSKETGGFDVSLSVPDSGLMSMQLLLGDDVKTSALDYSMYDSDGLQQMRVIFVDDSIAVNSYGNMDDPAEYEGYSNVTDTISSMLATYFGLDIDMNQMIKEGSINAEWVTEQSQQFLGLAQGMLGAELGGVSDITSLPLDSTDTEKYEKLAEDFFVNKCADKDFSSRFISGLSTIDVDGVKTSMFSFNTKAFVEAFKDYLSEISENEKFLEDNGLVQSDIEGLQSYCQQMIDEFGEDDDSDESNENLIDISIATENSMLKEISMTIDDEVAYLTFDKIGGSAIDLDGLRTLMSGMQLEDMSQMSMY